MERNDPIDAANRKAQELCSSLPHAMHARYDRLLGRVVIRLSTGAEMGFSPRDAQGLENASPAQLEEVEISPTGFGIHFPEIDADVYLPALLEGFLGSRNWIAARLGALVPDRVKPSFGGSCCPTLSPEKRRKDGGTEVVQEQAVRDPGGDSESAAEAAAKRNGRSRSRARKRVAAA